MVDDSVWGVTGEEGISSELCSSGVEAADTHRSHLEHEGMFRVRILEN